jgi:hypothetical protein
MKKHILYFEKNTNNDTIIETFWDIEKGKGDPELSFFSCSRGISLFSPVL